MEAISHSSYWAFSGEAKTSFYDADSQAHAVALPYTAHCVFEHDVDSRGPGIIDEGDMFLLQNGDTLEMGTMVNPLTGRNQLYKEYWTSATHPRNVPDSHSNLKYSVVAVAEDGAGMIIRIDGRIQGIVRDSSEPRTVNAGRWELIEDGTGVVSWQPDRRNSADLPWKWLAQSGCEVGDTITEQGRVWKVTECRRD